MRVALLCCAIVAAAVMAGAQLSAAPAKPVARKLLVISVDGLDWRYLRDRDALALSIPNLRHLLEVSEVADGVTGVWPTVTWPAHTSIITGVRPYVHGILANARGTLDPALSYWSPDKIKVPTLWQCAATAGKTTATITWPVTVGAKVTYNLPEAFVGRAGGSMDMDSIAKYATPGLVAEISKAYPSFPQQWMDDRTRAQATIFLLREKAPDLVLLHFVELDSEAHAQGPFSTHANAILERTDELIGKILAALPADYDLVLLSDHGFERVDKILNLPVLAGQAGLADKLDVHEGIVTTKDKAAAKWLRALTKVPGSGIGREIPQAELKRYAPELSDGFAFEPADHVWFGEAATGPIWSASDKKGKHGYWPLRHDYHSIYLHSGPQVKPAHLPVLEMVSLKDRLAGLLQIGCTK